MKKLITICLLATIFLCSCGFKGTKESQSKITAEMAYEGVSNYCHSAYDWSVAKERRRGQADSRQGTWNGVAGGSREASYPL